MHGNADQISDFLKIIEKWSFFLHDLVEKFEQVGVFGEGIWQLNWGKSAVLDVDGLDFGLSLKLELFHLFDLLLGLHNFLDLFLVHFCELHVIRLDQFLRICLIQPWLFLAEELPLVILT